MVREWCGGYPDEKEMRKSPETQEKRKIVTTLIYISRSRITSIWMIVCVVRH
jgi:hypothetical protein